jgi:hypothetical protein
VEGGEDAEEDDGLEGADAFTCKLWRSHTARYVIAAAAHSLRAARPQSADALRQIGVSDACLEAAIQNFSSGRPADGGGQALPTPAPTARQLRNWLLHGGSGQSFWQQFVSPGGEASLVLFGTPLLRRGLAIVDADAAGCCSDGGGSDGDGGGRARPARTRMDPQLLKAARRLPPERARALHVLSAFDVPPALWAAAARALLSGDPAKWTRQGLTLLDIASGLAVWCSPYQPKQVRLA